MTEQKRETGQDAANQGTASSERKPRRAGRVLRWTAIAVGGTLSALVLGVVIFLAIGISVDLSWLRDRIEAVASDALGRSVAIEGPIVLVPAMSPTVQVESIRVGNPDGWPDADFVRLNLARAQLGVLPLLRGGLQIDEITVDGLAVSLETNQVGEPNWILAAPEDAAPAEERPQPEDKAPTALQFVELRELSLTDIAVSVRDAATDRTHALRIDEITGSAEDEQPMDLVAKGSIEEIPFAVTLTAGSLATLLTGDAAWPVDLSATAFDTELALSGEIAEPLLGKGLALDFSVQGPDKQELEKILGTELPPIGSFDLRGRIGETDGAYRVTDLQGDLGAMTFSGALEVDLSGPRPRLQGAIDIPRIDAGALLAAIDAQGQSGSGAEPETGGPPNQTATAEPADQPSTIDVDQPLMVLTSLEAFDVDATLAIQEVVNGPVAISDAELTVTVADGTLVGPVNVTVAQVPLTGEVRLEPQDGKPAASVSLSAEESDIGELLVLVLGAEGVQGSFDSVELGFSMLGETVRALVQTAELRFALAGATLSYGHDTGGQPVEFTLDSFDMLVPAADESHIAAEGTLLSEAFALELSGGTFIENYIQDSWPFALTATGGGAEIQLSGTAASDPSHESPSELAFSIAGERVGDLSRWIGIPPDAELPYALNGQVTLTNYSVLARIDEARMGNTAFDGKVGLTKEDGPPVTLLELEFDTIDITELADNLAAETAETVEETAAPAGKTFTVDVPILPNDIELMDSDIRVAIARIKTGRSDITEASFSAQVRNGYLESAPVRATIAGATFEGTVSADLRGEIPMFDLDLNSTDVDVGDLLARLGVSQGLDVTAGTFELSLDLRGSSVRTILERSEFSAGISDGLLRLRDPNTDGSLDIGIPQGTIAAAVGAPIALDLDGRIDGIPVSIGIQTDSLASFAAPKDSLRATLDVALLNAELKLTGTTPLPIAPDNLRFELGISGDRISDFDELLAVSLPPWGPYQLAGKFGSRASGYFIDDFQLGVGGSTLTGTLELDTTQTPPRLDVNLVAPTVQLDDFDTGDWQAAEGGGETAEAAETEASTDDGNIRGLLSPQVMRSLDGSVTISVEEVVSGQDRLGSGTLVANLSDGRLVAEPIAVDVPGGSVEVGLALEPTETDIGLEARAKIEQLDYGLLARRIDPESTTGGLINVDVDIATRGSELSNVMAGSNGHIDFAVWPADLDAGLFDLWAVNLFTSILPSLDSEASKVNCIVARFSLTDGIMRPTALLLDTSRIQASGDGTIDFTTNTIDFVAAPNSKSPQMFSAQTPIQVRGSFSDFDFGVKPGGLAGTAIRMITSPLVVPFQWTFSENVPADGEVACREAWTRPAEG